MACKIIYKGISYDESDFKIQIERYVAINNLFNENESLANAVYETLGFKTDKKGLIELTHYSRNNQNPLDNFQKDFPLYTSKGESSEYKDYGKQFNYIVKKEATIKSLLDFHGKYGIDLDKHDEASKGLQPYHFNLQEIQAIRKEGVDILIDDWGEYVILNPNSVVLKEQQKQQAQQLYSQYLDSLKKPNTNPVLQNNQQEQVKKFVELQERLRNKEFLEGAKFAYESTSDLQSFGTQEQYNDYIARVSLGIIKNPSSGEYNYTSQVKDIVYHGTNKIFEEFSKEIAKKRAGFHFTTKSGLENSRFNFPKTNKTVLINIKNPLQTEDLGGNQQWVKDLLLKQGKIEEANKVKGWDIQKSLSPKNDGFIYNNEAENEGKNEISYMVFEPEQIHILGSKQDIEGFKEFVSQPNNSKKSDFKSPDITNTIEFSDKTIKNAKNKVQQQLKDCK